MKILMVAMLVFLAMSGTAPVGQTQAKASPQLQAEHWQCEAVGKISGGSPGRDTYISVFGNGETEYEASENAYSKCSHMGLQMCMTRSCFHRR